MIINMLIFERSYDDFIILSYDKVVRSEERKQKDHLIAQCRQIKQIERVYVTTTETIDACGYTPCNFQFVARVLDIEYSIAAQLKCFHCSCYVTHYACFYVMWVVKIFHEMYYFIKLIQLAVLHNINNGFSALVISCYFYS